MEVGMPMLENLRQSLSQDLRQAGRMLRRTPGFAAIAVLILGLGLGANTAVFSVVEAIVLRPLPLAQPGRLVWIAPQTSCGNSCSTYSAWAYEEFQQQTRALAGIAGYFAFSAESNYRYAGGGQPTPATGFYVTQNFFQLLGVQPALGRWFTPADAQKGAPTVTLLDNGYWRQHFHADRGVVGRTIVLNDKPVTVIGVLPASFDFGMLFAPGEHVDLFTPYVLDNWRNDGNDLALI
ncbi:MAG: ABC transporter permease, partial [Terriglobales bacterium]